MSEIGPSQSRCPERIVCDAQQGWMTGLGLPFANTYQLAKWGSDGALSFVILQPLALGDPPGFNPDAGFQGRVGNRFIMGGVRSNSDSIKIGEWDCNTGALLYEAQVGDAKSEYISAVSLPNNGGIAGVAAANSSPDNLILLDAFYRGPLMPPVPGGSEPPTAWWWNRFTFPSNTGSMLPYHTTAVWWKGFLWFFYTRDSAGQVGLAKLHVEGNELVLDYHDAGFINNGQEAACSGEYPYITAIVDPYGDRIVLGYHSNQMYPNSANPVQNSCDGGPWAVKWALTEVGAHLSHRLLGLADWWVNRNTQTRPVMFARPDGIYFALAYTNIKTDCAAGWNVGRFQDKRFSLDEETLPNGSMLALGDEWFIFYNRPANKTELRRMGSFLTIKQVGATVQLYWDPVRPGDVLEESVDGREWRAIGGTYSPPVTLPHRLDVVSHFFRLR